MGHGAGFHCDFTVGRRAPILFGTRWLLTESPDPVPDLKERGRSADRSLMRPLSIKNKILLALTILPMCSVAIVVTMAIKTFKQDKVTYIYDAVLADAQSKSSSASSQLASFVRILQGVTVNYDLQKKKLSENGQLYIQSQKNLKTFFDHRWDGKDFVIDFQSSQRGETPKEELKEINEIMARAWHQKLVILPLKTRPFHLILAARAGETSHINSIILEAPDFFSLFSSAEQRSSYLYTQEDGYLTGGKEVEDLTRILFEKMFSKNLDEMTTEGVLQEEDSLVSMAKTSVANLYIVSTVNKARALVALETLLRRAVLFTTALLALFIAFGVWSANRLVQSLRGLSAATSKVMKGDFTVKVNTRSNDEVGQLARSFNKMTDEVARLLDKTAENARMESELQTAKTVQDTLFPKSEARFGKVKLYGFSQPASECGGDWWYYCRSGSRVYLWIGDATGHGVPAALLTSAARAVASVIQDYPNFKPSEALRMLNQAIYATSKGQMMMTFFVACIDLEEGKMTYSNASHDPPYYLASGTPETPKKRDFFPLMEANGPRLGEKKNSKFKDYEMKIDLGDKIVLYTDGVFDVRSEDGTAWGERRFLKSLSGINSQPAEDTVSSVFRTIGEFREETPLDDDVTLVVVEYGQRSAA